MEEEEEGWRQPKKAVWFPRAAQQHPGCESTER